MGKDGTAFSIDLRAREMNAVKVHPELFFSEDI